jgi:hypothetical protein
MADVSARWWSGLPKECLWHGVFQGGGAKGVVYAGALRAFHGNGQWFCSVAGSSAGALTAAVIAAGWHPDELCDLSCRLLARVRPEARIDRGFSRVKATRWLARYSLLDMERELELCLRAGVKRNGGRIDGDVTFKALTDATGISLYVLALDASVGRPIPFCVERTPALPVSAAVAASCSIPYVFPPRYVAIDESSVPQYGSELHPPLRRLVDGGAWANFPAFIYNDLAFRDYYHLDALPPQRRVLGCVFDDQETPLTAPVPSRFCDEPRLGHRTPERILTSRPGRGGEGFRAQLWSLMRSGLVGTMCRTVAVFVAVALVVVEVAALRDARWGTSALATVGLLALALVAGIWWWFARAARALGREGLQTARSLLGLATAPAVWVSRDENITLLFARVNTDVIDTTTFDLSIDAVRDAVRVTEKLCNGQVGKFLKEGTTFIADAREMTREWDAILPKEDVSVITTLVSHVPTHTNGLSPDEVLDDTAVAEFGTSRG